VLLFSDEHVGQGGFFGLRRLGIDRVGVCFAQTACAREPLDLRLRLRRDDPQRSAAFVQPASST